MDTIERDPEKFYKSSNFARFMDKVDRKGVLLFEVYGCDNKNSWKFYNFGPFGNHGRSLSSFPEDALMMNRAPRFLSVLRAIWEKDIKGIVLPEEEIDSLINGLRAGVSPECLG